MTQATRSSQLIAALEWLGPKDHLCSIYETQQEHFAVVIPFIRIGLERGEKCIYIAADGTMADLREALTVEELEVDSAIARRALVLATKEQIYLKHGSFDPAQLSTFWKETTQLAMEEGFSGLRATGETEWLSKNGFRLEQWMEYETKLTHTLMEKGCIALCQYNRQIFPPEFMLDIIRTHPLVAYRGAVCKNLYHIPPNNFLGGKQTERQVEKLLASLRESQ